MYLPLSYHPIVNLRKASHSLIPSPQQAKEFLIDGRPLPFHIVAFKSSIVADGRLLELWAAQGGMISSGPERHDR